MPMLESVLLCGQLIESFYDLQCFVAVLLVAAVAQAVPVEYGHYAAPALVHAAPIYAHGPIAKHVIAEPDVSHRRMAE